MMVRIGYITVGKGWPEWCTLVLIADEKLPWPVDDEVLFWRLVPGCLSRQIKSGDSSIIDQLLRLFWILLIRSIYCGIFRIVTGK